MSISPKQHDLLPISLGSSFDPIDNTIITSEADLAPVYHALQPESAPIVEAAVRSLVGEGNADRFYNSSPLEIENMYSDVPAAVAEVLFADSFLQRVRAVQLGLRAVELGNVTGRPPSNDELLLQDMQSRGETAMSIIAKKGVVFDRHLWEKVDFDPEQLRAAAALEYPGGISVADAFAMNEVDILGVMLESVLKIARQDGVQVFAGANRFSTAFSEYVKRMKYVSNPVDQLDSALAAQAHLLPDEYSRRRSIAKPLLAYMLPNRIADLKRTLPVSEGSYVYQPMHQELYAMVTIPSRLPARTSWRPSTRRGKGISGNPAKRPGARTPSEPSMRNPLKELLDETTLAETQLAPEIIDQKNALEHEYLQLIKPFIGISNSTLRNMNLLGGDSAQAKLHERANHLDSMQLIRTYVGLHDIASRLEDQTSAWVEMYLRDIDNAYAKYYRFCREKQIPETLRSLLPRIDATSIATLRDNWTVILGALESVDTSLRPELSQVIAEGISVDKSSSSQDDVSRLPKRRATNGSTKDDTLAVIEPGEAEVQMTRRQVDSYMYDLQTRQPTNRTIEDQLRKLFSRQHDLREVMEQIVSQIPALFDTANGQRLGIDKLQDFSNYSMPIYRLKPTAVPGLGEHTRVGIAADWRIILTVDPTSDDKLGDVRIIAFVKREDLTEAIRQLRR